MASKKSIKSFLYTYRYLFGTILVAAFLVIPWGLSVLSHSLEPYPAVIMPSGEALVSLESNILDYERQSIWVQTQDDDWERLEPSEFLGPIPVQYFFAINSNGFGLIDGPKTEVFPFRLLPDMSVERNKVTQKEAAEAKIWLADNLRRLGYKGEQFEIRTEALSINRQLGDITEQETKNVKSYDLR